MPQSVQLQREDRAWRRKKPRERSSNTTSTMSYSGALMPADSSQSSAHTAGGARSTCSHARSVTDWRCDVDALRCHAVPRVHQDVGLLPSAAICSRADL